MLAATACADLAQPEEELPVATDLRFPRGATLEAQRPGTGRYFRVNREGDETGNTWTRSD